MRPSSVGHGVSPLPLELLRSDKVDLAFGSMLDVPADQYRVFSGVAPLPRHPASGFVAQTALVHADGHTPDLAELLQEMADRTETGYLFGGLSASRTANVQFAVGGNGNMAGQGAASGVFDGGLSGVAFGPQVPLLSRVTQGELLARKQMVQEMIAGLSEWMDDKGHADLDAFRGRAVPNVTDWQYLNLNYVTKAVIDQDSCIKCGRCYAACEDTSHQAIAMSADRTFTVKEEECVACNLCIDVCPVESCITMRELPPGEVDKRTGRKVGTYANWTTHPNNPMARAAE